jgi:DNA-binding transcriptional LysR family regulator
VSTECLRIVSFDSSFETLTAAERGHGVAFGLFPMTTPWVQAGRLAVPFRVRTPIEGGVHFVYRPNDPRGDFLTEVAAWLAEEYACLPPLPHGRIA